MERIESQRWRALCTRLAEPPVISAAHAEAERVLQPWRDLSGPDIVRSLLVQVAVIGNARGGYRFGQALREPGFIEGVIATQTNRDVRLHALARSSGVRFVGADSESPKVRAWCSILSHPQIVTDGVLVVRERMQAVLAACAVNNPASNRHLRELLVSWHLPMIGRKSWSDWLNNRGLTRHLLAIDTRLIGVWRRYLGTRVRLESFQDAATYDAWEQVCEQHLAKPLGITLSELDKRLFMLPTFDRHHEDT